MNVTSDFKKFATSNAGISSMVLDDVIKCQNQYLNPYILEERQLNVTQMDVFSRLMMDRIIFLGTQIDDYTANTLKHSYYILIQQTLARTSLFMLTLLVVLFMQDWGFMTRCSLFRAMFAPLYGHGGFDGCRVTGCRSRRQALCPTP